MNNELVASLTDEGVNVEARYLEKEINRAGEYKAMENDATGILLLKEMETRRDLARDLYRHINPHHEGALTALIQLQAAEGETTEWLTRVGNSQKYITELRARRSSLDELVQRRKKAASESSMFVPKASGKGTKQNANDTRRDGSSDKG